MVAEFSYFTLRFIARRLEYVGEVPLGQCNPRRRSAAHCQMLLQGENVGKPLHSGTKEGKECALEELVKDCPRLRSEHGYEDKPVSEEELDFPLAFSIKMHANTHQVERLLRTIYRPHNFYCIHVDLKATNETYELIKRVAGCLKNVVILAQRINIVYGSIRFVMAELACMKCCMESNVRWKYYINLSGQEFVLRTNLEIVKILKIFNGVNDIESYKFTQMFRIELSFLLINDHVVKEQKKRQSFGNITLRKGSAYGMFSRDFVNFVLTDEIAIQFYQWLNTTYAPEETIWPTLNRLPFAPGGYQGFDVKHDDQTHISKTVLWAYEHIRCHGKYVRGICIFTSGDLTWLHSRPEIAANKFHEKFDSVVLDCLEEWVNRRTYSASLEGLNWYHYRNLPHVKYYKNLKESQKTKEYLKKQKEIWIKIFHS